MKTNNSWLADYTKQHMQQQLHVFTSQLHCLCLTTRKNVMSGKGEQKRTRWSSENQDYPTLREGGRLEHTCPTHDKDAVNLFLVRKLYLPVMTKFTLFHFNDWIKVDEGLLIQEWIMGLGLEGSGVEVIGGMRRWG